MKSLNNNHHKIDGSVVVIESASSKRDQNKVVTLILEEIHHKLKKWNDRADIPDDVKKQLNAWAKKVGKLF